MPAFRYFATLEDSLVILRDLCDRRLKIMTAPGAPVRETVTDELAEILRVEPGFFLAPDFSRFPFQIMQATVGRVAIIEGQSTLLPGGLVHLTHYRNPATDKVEPASKELHTAYTLACLTIRNRCTRATADVFVAPGALGLIQQRKAVLAAS